MGWYCYYLSNFNIKPFNWTIIILLGFEVLYIAFQAAKGQLSHFNVSTPLYSMLYTLMGLAAALVTIYTAYIGLYRVYIGLYRFYIGFYMFVIGFYRCFIGFV